MQAVHMHYVPGLSCVLTMITLASCPIIAPHKKHESHFISPLLFFQSVESQVICEACQPERSHIGSSYVLASKLIPGSSNLNGSSTSGQLLVTPFWCRFGCADKASMSAKHAFACQ